MERNVVNDFQIFMKMREKTDEKQTISRIEPAKNPEKPPFCLTLIDAIHQPNTKWLKIQKRKPDLFLTLTNGALYAKIKRDTELMRKGENYEKDCHRK